VAGRGGNVVIDSESNVDWSVFACKSCGDMLEGFNYEKSNICEGSLDIWKKLTASICYNSVQDNIPCYNECKYSLCLDTQPATDACISCIADSKNDKMQSRLIECFVD
jgi:hypothetical protein